MSACRKCAARIVWAVTERGKSMPVNRDPVENGNLVLEEQDGRPPIARKPDELLDRDLPRYVSHFATCPNAEEFRR